MDDKTFIENVNSKWFRWKKCDLCGKEVWDESKKTMLDLKARPFFEIDIGVIENKIERLLGLTVEIIPDGEMHNGYTPCSVDAIDMSDEIKEYKDGSQWAMGLHGWMDHLCFLNVIPHGSYLVDHSW